MDNLRLASEDEAKEAEVYTEFANTAREEGFEEIAHLFEMTKNVEDYHRQIFTELFEQMCDNTLYKKEEPVTWVCGDCGYMATGTEPWDECPLCKAKRESVKLILKAKMLNELCVEE